MESRLVLSPCRIRSLCVNNCLGTASLRAEVPWEITEASRGWRLGVRKTVDVPVPPPQLPPPGWLDRCRSSSTVAGASIACARTYLPAPTDPCHMLRQASRSIRNGERNREIGKTEIRSDFVKLL
jgi:hypothetical protein